MTRNEDFLFAQEAIAQGFVSEAQVEEALLLQRRMAEDLKLDERLGVILVKRGYLAEDQARRVYARIEPEKTGEIRGYRLLDVIGRGAMGTVYRALHLGLNRVVALKILRPDLQADRTQVERLKAEAAMLASLDHPNVVRVLDAGESNGYPYFVMEYVEGETLRDRLRREGPLPEADALRITRAMADALERARRMGIVHRDVKPGNVLLARNGTPKLMDLGLAKGPIDLGLTQHGATVGTPQYISPEQAVDPRKADTRSDIYGLGATLYAMLTGEPPFDGQTLAEILTKVLYETPVPVRTRRPDVSREAGFLVERMMLKDPTLRYKVPAAVVADIDRIEQGASILPSGFTGSWEGWLLRARTRKMLLTAGAAAAVLAIGVVGGGFAMRAVRAERERTAYEQRAERVLRETTLDADDDDVDVREKALTAWSLLDEMRDRDVEPDNREELRRRAVDLDQEREHFDRLAEVLRKEVVPARERGDWAEAEAALARYVAERQNRPARRRAERALADLQVRSDEALRAARDAQFQGRLDSFEVAAARIEDWFARALPRFANTPYARAQRTDAFHAHQAARALREEIAGAALPAAEVRTHLDALEFGLLRDRIEERAQRATFEAQRRKPALSPFVGDAASVLVRAPFERTLEDLREAVERTWFTVVARADEEASAGRVHDAIDRIERFERAARAPFPSIAATAAQKAAGLEQMNAAQVAQAEVAWDLLLRRVRAALRAGDAEEVRRVAAEARADPAVYGPLRGRVDRLAPAADLYDEMWDRVARALEERVGPDKKSWLDTVPLRDGTKDHAWEIRSVDRAARRVTIVSHRGNINREPETRSLVELAPDFLVSLAGLRSRTRDDAVKAVYLLSLQPDDEEDLLETTDPNARLASYRTIRDLFDQGGQGGSPLALWVEERFGSLETRSRDLEKIAAETLAAAKGFYAKGDNTWAFNRFIELKRAPLSFTKVVAENIGEIDGKLQQILVEMDSRKLELLLPHAKVKPLPHGDLTEITYDFDTLAQGENFREGLARFVEAPGGSPLTPGQTTNQRLRLLPAPDGGPMLPGELVRDRPLAMTSPLDPTKERSIAFWLWTADPFFHAIDLDGVQTGVLSADPTRWPFGDDVPALDDERRPPALDFYGRGLGVVFRQGVGRLGKAWEWNAWKEDNQGRRFVPPDRNREARKLEMHRRWFGFVPQPDRPYRVRFVYVPLAESATVRLEVDSHEVHAESGGDWRPRVEGRPEAGKVLPSGLIQILTYTTCDIDDLVITGKISERWRETALREKERAAAPRKATDEDK